MSYWVFWLVCFVLFLIMEAIIPGLVCIWFAAGAMAALALSFFLPLWLQLIFFIVVSLVTLFAARPFIKRSVNSTAVPTNLDMVIGKEAVVTEDIDNLRGTGAAVVSGKTWTARSSDDSPIPAGKHVEIIRIEGVKLIVSQY